MSAIKLRNYQQEALEAVKREFEVGINSQLIVLPTGSGKTLVMAAIAKHFNKKVLILAHRDELIKQASAKIRLFWPEASIGICKAEKNEIEGYQIVIGSVQSCSQPNRLLQLKQVGFEILLVDEAHHIVAPTYQKIINELGFVVDKNKLLIGFTATPDRDGLKDIFSNPVFFRSISTLIQQGYLSRVIGRKILTSFLLENVRTENGDFVIKDLAQLNTSSRNNFIVTKFTEHAATRKTVAFCVDVKHAQDLAVCFQNSGFKSAAVWGAMMQEEREKTLENFRNGEIQVITSCAVLTEGWDEESIEAVLMCRPTKSKILYTQCIGRGIRPWPTKENCLVLDFADNGLSLDSIMSLKSAIPDAIEIQEIKKTDTPKEKLNKDNNPNVVELLDEEFDILGRNKFIWISLGDDEYSLADDLRREIVIHPVEGGFIAILINGKNITQIVKQPLPLDYCLGVCEDYARANLKLDFATTNGSYLKNCQRIPASPGQIKFLKKHKVKCNDMSKAQAAFEIRRVIALERKKLRQSASEPLTEKQRILLNKFGYDAGNLSKLEAGAMISAIIKQRLEHYSTISK